ncbi:hypothetical protein HDA40_000137 [Hamadaea flava]|uniref:Uncharacterized protein n=1 Tax=Hamadaea flava TaxID=1742688 RepID=A0ABV8LXX5_9ACTN|nr:hypothetical protein [Hamadaea flava]MCP2321630.1 hypothetical protein [Hamadaea flava]
MRRNVRARAALLVIVLSGLGGFGLSGCGDSASSGLDGGQRSAVTTAPTPEPSATGDPIGSPPGGSPTRKGSPSKASGTPTGRSSGAPSGMPSGSPKGSGKPRGALVFDPFAKISCTWVPRLFVDLSGHAKPGVAVRVPVWASNLAAGVTLTIRAELNGSSYRTTTTVTAAAPEWRGTAQLAMALPESGDFFSTAIELDSTGKLAGKTTDNSRRTVAGTLPSPRPSSEEPITCPTVT